MRVLGFQGGRSFNRSRALWKRTINGGVSLPNLTLNSSKRASWNVVDPGLKLDSETIDGNMWRANESMELSSAELVVSNTPASVTN